MDSQRIGGNITLRSSASVMLWASETKGARAGSQYLCCTCTCTSMYCMLLYVPWSVLPWSYLPWGKRPRKYYKQLRSIVRQWTQVQRIPIWFRQYNITVHHHAVDSWWKQYDSWQHVISWSIIYSWLQEQQYDRGNNIPLEGSNLECNFQLISLVFLGSRVHW